MAEQQNISKPVKGLFTDTHVLDQPKATYRFALNGVIETDAGDLQVLSNEEGTEVYVQMQEDSYFTIGSVYIGDNEHIMFLSSGTKSAIVKLQRGKTSSQKVEYLILDATPPYILNFQLASQIQATYRLRRGCEKWIYFVDGNNELRSFNATDPSAYVTEEEFNLIKGYDSRPSFDSIEILKGGQLKSGSYNFAIQYIDDSENETEWITTSMPVPIYVDLRTGNYNSVIGSSNIPEDSTDSQTGEEPANKAIRLTMSNLDSDYQYYRIAVIEATSGLGIPTRVLLSTKQLIEQNTFVYDGNTSGYSEISIDDILLEKLDLGIPSIVSQADSRLLVANTDGKDRSLCELQKYASKIKTEYVTEEVDAWDYNETGNPKDPNTMWEKMSAMGGEVYALGIVYIFDDDTESPAYHIPGRPEESDGSDRTAVNNDDSAAIGSGDIETWRVYDTADGAGKMAFWEMQQNVYPPLTTCDDSDPDSYWGLDYEGNSLVGEKIRLVQQYLMMELV